MHATGLEHNQILDRIVQQTVYFSPNQQRIKTKTIFNIYIAASSATFITGVSQSVHRQRKVEKLGVLGTATLGDFLHLGGSGGILS